MQEAYRVGVTIAISGDVGSVINKLVGDFERLDKAVGSSKTGLGNLTNALKGMASEGKAAADAWQNVAKALQASAKAAKEAAAAGGSMRAAAERQRTTSAAQDAINSANAASQARRQSPGTALVPVTPDRGRYGNPESGPLIQLPYSSSSRDLMPSGDRSVVPYWNGNRDHTMVGDSYTPYGEYGQSRPSPGPGTALAPYKRPDPYFNAPGTGFTMNGGPYVGGAPGGGGGAVVPYGGPSGEMPPLHYYPGVPTNWRQEWHGLQSQANGMTLLPDMAGFAWLKTTWEKGAEFAKEQSHLAAQGFTPAEVKKAGDTALDTARNVPGISPMAALHIVDKLMNVTQDKETALDPKLIDSYAKMSVVLSSYGHGGDELGELDAAIRGGEFRGALTHEGKDGKREIDIKGLTEFLDRLTAMNAISGGDIGPRKVLGFLRSSGAAGTLISPEELTRSMALQIALGQSKAGSALQGFEQQFTAGRMSEAAANLLIEMGIIKGGGDAKHNPYLVKMGPGQMMMRPGAMPEGMQEEAAKNPSFFIMEQLLPRFREKILEVYGDRYTKGDEKTRLMYESAMAQQVASRIPGGNEMTEVIRNVLLMGRDVDAVDKALKRNQYQIASENNPVIQAQALKAANDALETTVGKSTIPLAAPALLNLTGALNDLTKWAQEHSPEVKLGLEALTGALIALGSVGIIALAGMLSPLSTALIVLGAAVGPAAKGIEALGQKITALMAPFSQPAENLGAALAGKAPVDLSKVDPSKVRKGMVLPWWMPIPVPAGGEREPRPSWMPNIWQELGLASAHGATLGKPGSAPNSGDLKPAAPSASIMFQQGPKGTSTDPIMVHVQNQLSGSDIARGVSTNQASKANRPPTGYTGTDNRIDPLGYFSGMVNMPN